MSKYGPMLNRDWVGLRVRLEREAENSLCNIPAGTVGKVTGYSPGGRAIQFRGDPCKCCGVSVRAAALQRTDFTILTPKDQWPDTRGRKQPVKQYDDRRW